MSYRTYIGRINSTILFKGKNKGIVYLRPITIGMVLDCFKQDFEKKYHYLGYVYPIFREGTEGYKLNTDLIKFIDKQTKPWWCPRSFLNLLNLLGNDNSIVRVRNRRLHKLLLKLTGGVRITDQKTKWDTVRIYGSFTKEIQDEVTRVSKEMNKLLDN
jgi:hypothetical protein